MTECMTRGCENTATHYYQTKGFFVDDYRCREHTSPKHIPISQASKSIQRVHRRALAESSVMSDES